MVDVAFAARVSPETLRKIESGRIATPAFATVASLAAALGLSLDEMWTEIAQAPVSAADDSLDALTRTPGGRYA
jgi:transcriptional regulator with XRE-family HTH domain